MRPRLRLLCCFLLEWFRLQLRLLFSQVVPAPKVQNHAPCGSGSPPQPWPERLKNSYFIFFQAFSAPNLDYSSNSVFNTTPNQSSNQPNSTPHSQSNMFANNLSVLSPNQPIGLTSNQPTQLTVLAPNQPTVFAHNPPTALAHNKPTLAAPKSTLFSSTPNLASGLQFQFPPSSLPPPPAIQPTPQGSHGKNPET